jgi:hypothetical protein
MASFKIATIYKDHATLRGYEKCGLDLVMAGWDLKLDSEGTYWCLEANPVPGYRLYDAVVDGAISLALIRLLTDGPVTANGRLRPILGRD